MDDEITIEIQNQNKKNIKKTNKKRSLNKKAAKKAATNKRTSNEEKDVSLKNVKKAPIKNVKQKSKKRKFPKILLAFIFIFVIVLILASNLFNIKEIKVTGNVTLLSEEIISLSKIRKHTNIFKINTSQVVKNIKQHAYIEKVSINKKFPNEIQIEVEERIPKYMLQFADSFAYINNQGYILEIANEKLSIPILTGITTEFNSIEKPGNRLNKTDLKKMNTVIKIVESANSNQIGHLISKIDISDDKNYTLILETEGKKVYLGDCSELNTRILYLKSILEQEKGISGELFLNEDLSEQKVHFKPSI